MPVKVYSLWLMPAPADLAEFTGINRDLASRFGTPPFDPHLTLIGGTELELDRLKPGLADVARGIAPFRAPVLEVVTGPAFYQSFYALFAAEGPILELKQRSMRLLGEPVGQFMPHVSLLYGDVAAGPKEKAREALAKTYKGREIGFSSLAISLSGPGVEVKDWVIEYELPLG